MVKKKMMMVAWVCGILASIVVFSSVLAAISQSPWFSWTANALSDLGVSGAASIFNSGLIVGGILMMVFAAGLLVVGRRALERAGAALLFIGAIALSGIGVFTEAGDIHFYVAVAFFGISSLSLLLIGSGSIVAGSKKFGRLTVLAGVLAGLPWAFSWAWIGLAIPETLSAIVIFVWVIAEGAKLCVGK